MQGSFQQTEIRVACGMLGHPHQDNNPLAGSHWHPDSVANREMLRIIMESANEIHGPGTHWVEVREACSLTDWIFF